MSSFEKEADQLLGAGWQQCSTFYPNEIFGSALGLPEGAVLLMLTQSCSVVSAPLERDPYVELIVATKEKGNFNARSPEAKGANARKFRLELHDNGGATPYLLDIYQRHMMPRETLLTLKPDGPACSREDAVRVANWVARFYNRSALPTEMVNRLRTANFQKTVSDILAADFQGAPLHEQVTVIYGAWEPDDETGPYEFDLDLIVRSVEAVEFLLETLQKTFGLPTPEIKISNIDGLSVAIEVLEHETVPLSHLDGRKRISEWDLLSGLLEEA